MSFSLSFFSENEEVLLMFTFLIAAVHAFEPYSSSYTIRGSWRVPYTNLSNPILVATTPGRQYVSKYNGLEETWTSLENEGIYRKRVVADDKVICFSYIEGVTPDWEFDIVTFLPSPDDFYLVGNKSVNGHHCEHWQRVENTPKKQTWDFYIDSVTKQPISYQMTAISIYSSHYDLYILDIDDYTPYVLPSYWNYPSLTECSTPIPVESVPLPPGPDKAKIKNDHIRRIRNSLGLRRNLRSKFQLKKSESECTPYLGTSDYDPPKTFSWRNTTVVGPPRDQVACGSCWAFGTAESLEGQLALKTGLFRPISVNQIVDCTWDAGNNGCDGGESYLAFSSMSKSSLPLALEKDYPYIGVSGYCNRNVPPVARVVGCYEVAKSTKVLKEALQKLGPVSIGINVPESMLMYTGGAYYDAECTGTNSDLVHEVLLTGWTVIDGKEVWEVKNSWSTYWGDEGYIFIQSEDQEHNCGVTTSAHIPIIDLY